MLVEVFEIEALLALGFVRDQLAQFDQLVPIPLKKIKVNIQVGRVQMYLERKQIILQTAGVISQLYEADIEHPAITIEVSD